MQSTIRTRDITVGIAGLAIAALLGHEAYGMSYPSKVFPLVICVAIFFLSMLIALRAAFRSGTLSCQEARFMPSFRSLFVVATAVVYVWLINVLGFYVSSFLCIIIVSIITESESFTKKMLLKTTIATCIFLGMVYVIFSYLFNTTISGGVLF